MGSLKVTLKRSVIGRPEKQRNVLKSLGFAKKINSSVVVEDTDAIRRSIGKVAHLVEVEELSE